MWILRESSSECFFTFFTTLSSLHLLLSGFVTPAPSLPGKGSSLCIVSASFPLIPFPGSSNILIFFPLLSLLTMVWMILFPFFFYPISSESNTCVLLLFGCLFIPLPLLLGSSCPLTGPQHPTRPPHYQIPAFSPS